MEWKDAYPYKLRDINPNGKPSAQEIAVAGMLEPSHLLDIVQNFKMCIRDRISFNRLFN